MEAVCWHCISDCVGSWYKTSKVKIWKCLQSLLKCAVAPVLVFWRVFAIIHFKDLSLHGLLNLHSKKFVQIHKIKLSIGIFYLKKYVKSDWNFHLSRYLIGKFIKILCQCLLLPHVTPSPFFPSSNWKKLCSRVQNSFMEKQTLPIMHKWIKNKYKKTDKIQKGN